MNLTRDLEIGVLVSHIIMQIRHRLYTSHQVKQFINFLFVFVALLVILGVTPGCVLRKYSWQGSGEHIGYWGSNTD